MKKKSIIFWLPLSILFFGPLGKAQVERINATIPRAEAESHLRFLAADELRGRNTGTIELNIAARYIAEQFRKSGLAPLGDDPTDYLQRVPLYSTNAPSVANVEMLDQKFDIKDKLAVLTKDNVNLSAPIYYLEDPEQIASAEFKGKIVVSVIRNTRAAIRNADFIAQLEAGGALASIEVFSIGQGLSWERLSRYFNRTTMEVGQPEGTTQLPRVWVEDLDRSLLQKLKELDSGTANLIIEGATRELINTFNVVGKIEGTDPVLKNQHLVMCAHYDHVGVQVTEEGQDSIYNGTRDNGIGTTGLINAAHYFGKYPPKRSVIIIALTGEEKGLLGSRYYADNPKIPLEETVFAFNIDNSGYTTTDVLTLLDTARTNIDPLIYQAASEFDLGVIGDRLPSQNYYERSDQVSFAQKGVPAVNFKMSMTAFDERISDFYHQPSDEIKNVDLDYIYKYWRAYIRSAELVGNWEKTPYWMPGDKFEPMGDALYKK
ncbi:MAG: M20/M25/M40 family metallo-hydrolase [Saprospiraceae bacterium]